MFTCKEETLLRLNKVMQFVQDHYSYAQAKEWLRKKLPTLSKPAKYLSIPVSICIGKITKPTERGHVRYRRYLARACKRMCAGSQQSDVAPIGAEGSASDYEI